MYIYVLCMYVCAEENKEPKFWYKTICMHVCMYVYDLLMKS